jgi:hypothetical protein
VRGEGSGDEGLSRSLLSHIHHFNFGFFWIKLQTPAPEISLPIACGNLDAIRNSVIVICANSAILNSEI